MDPYDAIVEQLKSVREQRYQALKDQLAGVLESLESVTASIRDAAEAPADETLPLEEIELSLNTLKDAAAEAAAEAAAAPPPSPVTLELLRALDEAGSQSDLLHGLLSALARHAARAVVLVFRPDGVGAWSAIGFDDASRLARWSCARADSPVFAEFEENAVPVRFVPTDDPVVRDWLEGEDEPEEALLIPISLRGRVMGAVYADRQADAPWDPGAVQLLVAVACWMIDTLKYRGGAPSPALRDIAGWTAAAAAEVEPSQEEAAEDALLEEAVEVAEQPEAIDEIEELEQAEDAHEAVDVEEAPAAAAGLDELASEPGFDPSATVQVEEPEPAPPIVAEPGVTVETSEVTFEPEPVVAEPAEEEDEFIEVDEVELPPPVEPVRPPTGFRRDEPAPVATELSELSPEEQSQHEEARRFARLLVSEIKLYNEDAVERGRAQRDLYHRLKDDIDRSREMYEKRIPADIRAAHDHFQDELVRILAGGDVGALGM